MKNLKNFFDQILENIHSKKMYFEKYSMNNSKLCK